MAPRSALGRFFRRLADFFDRHAEQKKSGTRFLRAYAGTALEIDFFAFGILFFGILIAGITIHGFAFAGWVLLFAILLSAGAWLIFYSAHWREERRALLLAFLLVVSTDAVSERLLALFAFIPLSFLLLSDLNLLREQAARIEDRRGNNLRSVLAVLLFCFVAYEGFSVLIAMQRNAMLDIKSPANMACGAGVQSRIACRAGAARFDVPDFWQNSEGSNLIQDLQSVAAFKTYRDSATDNQIAFAAFWAPAENILTSLQTFLDAQKAFLRSRVPNTPRGSNQPPLKLQPVAQAADVQLHTVAYVSSAKPGYLGEESESTAILLLHRRGEVTWLFILDGNDFAGREFLLHRIMSGFK
ncbi:MAG: hypothetical protein U1F27_12980 [Turneriella sp.]